MPIIKIYTDGSCLDNHKSKKGLSFGGYGCHILYPTNDIEEFSAGLTGSKITNNIGEFMAFDQALNRMIEIGTRDIIHLYTDSAYLINTYTKWASTWEANGWKKANGKDVENVEMIQDIYTKLNSSGLVVIFKKVKAHQDEPDRNSSGWCHWYGNNRADELAKLCATDMKEASEETAEKEKKEKVREIKEKAKAKTTKTIKTKKIKKKEPTPDDDDF